MEVVLTSVKEIESSKKSYKDVRRENTADENKLTLVNCSLCSEPFAETTVQFMKNKLLYPSEEFHICKFCSNLSHDSHGFSCSLCDKVFQSKSNLKIHQRFHFDENASKYSEIYFSYHQNLKEHKGIQSAEKSKNSEGNESYSQGTNLNCHEEIESFRISYKCEYCCKCFSKKSVFVHHKRVHTGEKPYQCDLCHMCFSQNGSLERHKRIHSGEKPYKCDICYKRFSNSTILKHHRRVHTGEKPYQCDVCNKSFSQKSTLTSHKRLHSGEKPFKCNICCQRFFGQTSLNRHRKGHARTRAKAYQCDVCNKRFTRKFDIKRHEKNHFKEQ